MSTGFGHWTHSAGASESLDGCIVAFDDSVGLTSGQVFTDICWMQAVGFWFAFHGTYYPVVTGVKTSWETYQPVSERKDESA
jgi:hypothetical protein